MTCDVVFNLSGNHSQHEITIDTDSGIVRDADLTFAPGAGTPGSEDLKQWTDVAGPVARWGNRHARSGQPTSVFRLDLGTGRYTLTSTANGEVSHGACGGSGPTS